MPGCFHPLAYIVRLNVLRNLFLLIILYEKPTYRLKCPFNPKVISLLQIIIVRSYNFELRRLMCRDLDRISEPYEFRSIYGLFYFAYVLYAFRERFLFKYPPTLGVPGL